MKFSERLKVFQLNILRQAGVSVTPEQLGLKRDPIAEAQAKSQTGPFSSILNRMGGLQGIDQGIAPPAPPVNFSDSEAVARYQQEMLAYQQKLQVQNQRFMQMMMQQMQAMQQAMTQAQRQNSNTTQTSSSPLGIGSILGTSDS